MTLRGRELLRCSNLSFLCRLKIGSPLKGDFMDTNEYACWRAGEYADEEQWCDWCGEHSPSDICPACEERYREETADAAADAWGAAQETAEWQRP
jgi:hypothetical protein